MKKDKEVIYVTRKWELLKIQRYSFVIEDIQRIVSSSHLLAIHTMEFLKAYLLQAYDEMEDRIRSGSQTDGTVFPNITTDMINYIMVALLIRKDPDPDGRGRPPSEESMEAINTFLRFYDNESYPKSDDIISGKHSVQVRKYLATQIKTCYETNIKLHFPKYLKCFISSFFENPKSEENKRTISQVVCRILQRNLPLPAELVAGELSELGSHLNRIFPTHRLLENSYEYDIECQPQKYLPSMIYMMKFVQSRGRKVLNAFPLRTECIPKYITIDSLNLLQLFAKKVGSTIKEFKNQIEERRDEIWALFFKTHLKCFKKKGYHLSGTIQTDGIYVSIRLQKNGTFSGMEKMRKKRKIGQVDNQAENQESQVEPPEGSSQSTNTEKPPPEFEWIDRADLSSIQNLRVVGIDPGIKNLLSCATKNKDGDVIKMNHSQNQRRKELKTKLYRNIRESMANNTTIDGATIKEWETELSRVSHKTYDLDEFFEYVKLKNAINMLLIPYYSQKTFRKLRWNAYINNAKSEAKLLKQFKQIFGGPKNVVIGFGGWNGNSLRNTEPTKCKGFRRLFKRAGYKVFLVNEYFTSKQCFNCTEHDRRGINEKFLEVDNPRPWRHDRILRHGLLRCKTCGCMWNRDLNGALNIYRITLDTLKGLGRPYCLQRPSSDELSGSPPSVNEH